MNYSVLNQEGKQKNTMMVAFFFFFAEIAYKFVLNACHLTNEAEQHSMKENVYLWIFFVPEQKSIPNLTELLFNLHKISIC